MSQESSYKWKYKREKRRIAKPYSRPTNESVIGSVASTVKDKFIPSWLKSVANYLLPSSTSEEPEIAASASDYERDRSRNYRTTLNCNSSGDGNRAFASANQDGLSQPRAFGSSNADELSQPHHSREALNEPLASELSNIANQASSQPLSRVSRCDGAVDEEASSTSSNTASSTSGCSSLVPSHQDHLLQKINVPGGKNSLETLRKELLKKTRDVSVETESKSNAKSEGAQSFLWSHNSSQKPEFNVSKFFSPSSVLEQNRSLFYEGKTSFGGASAKRARLFGSSPYADTNRIPSIIRVKVNERTRLEDNLSNTAKRILANMEKLSSPLEDAKKAPVYNEPLENITTGFRNTSSLLSATFGGLSNRASLETSIKKPNLNFQAKKVISRPTPVVEEPPRKDASVGGKIRARVSKTYSRPTSKRAYPEDEQPVAFHPLPIKSLPWFNLNSFKPNTFDSRPLASSVSPLKNACNNRGRESQPERLEFEFHAPIMPQRPIKPPSSAAVSISEPQELSSTVRETDSGVQIEKVPVSQDEDSVPSKNASSATSSTEKPNVPKETQSDDFFMWSCPKCMIKNSHEKAMCVACGVKKSGEAAKENLKEAVVVLDKLCKICHSVTDVSDTCNRCSTKEEVVIPEEKKEEPGIAAKPSDLKSKAESPVKTQGWGTKFKPASDTWECETCLVRNKSSDDACVACEMPKPNANKGDVKQSYSGYNFANVDTKTTTPVFRFGFSADSTPKTDAIVNNKTEESKTPTTQLEGFGGFSKTSPTLTITTSMGYQTSQQKFSTTNTGFAFGSLSSTAKTNDTTLTTSSNTPRVAEKPKTDQPAKENVTPDSTTALPPAEPKSQAQTTPSTTAPLFTFGTGIPTVFSKKDSVPRTSASEKPASTNNAFTFGSKLSGSSTTTTTSPSFTATFSEPETNKDEPPNKFSRSFGGPFVFGNANKADNTPKINATPSLVPPNTEASKTSPSGGFKFSVAPLAPATGSFLTLSTAGSTLFSNTVTATPSSLAVTTATTVATTTKGTSGFSFGSIAAVKTTNTGFTFGSMAPTVTTTASSVAPPSFSFGEKPTTVPTFGFGTPTTTSSGFSFGQSQALPSTSTFVFGSATTTASTNNTSQGFNFNASNAAASDFKPPSFGQNNLATPKFQFGQAVQQPALNFGASAQPSVPQQPLVPQLNFSQTPNFNFGGQDTFGGVFQFAANASEQVNSGPVVQRNIKKAKRRLGGPP